MEIRNLKKQKRKDVTVVYDDGLPKLKTNLRYIGLPTTEFNIQDYSSDIATLKVTPTPACTKKSNIYERTYCAITNNFKKKKIQYKYYTGHGLTRSQVLQKKYGNCCDLARVVDEWAKPKISTRRYVKGVIELSGVEFDHIWNQLFINDQWLNYDAVSLLTGAKPGHVYGNPKTITEYISSTNNDPCN
jgi:transglutaminase-like putative cysteine protease